MAAMQLPSVEEVEEEARRPSLPESSAGTDASAPAEASDDGEDEQAPPAAQQHAGRSSPRIRAEAAEAPTRDDDDGAASPVHEEEQPVAAESALGGSSASVEDSPPPPQRAQAPPAAAAPATRSPASPESVGEPGATGDGGGVGTAERTRPAEAAAAAAAAGTSDGDDVGAAAPAEMVCEDGVCWLPEPAAPAALDTFQFASAADGGGAARSPPVVRQRQHATPSASTPSAPQRRAAPSASPAHPPSAATLLRDFFGQPGGFGGPPPGGVTALYERAEGNMVAYAVPYLVVFTLLLLRAVWPAPLTALLVTPVLAAQWLSVAGGGLDVYVPKLPPATHGPLLLVAWLLVMAWSELAREALLPSGVAVLAHALLRRREAADGVGGAPGARQHAS
uniref:PRA1 family protein n=1 Tax=Bicosoecida sp. CB-2014 TaxID=1486930 RepID=A0A7S1C930_9STRA